eukprot:scaffold2335_cov135-Skeletonema_menzelii.AAC.1
MTKKLTNNGIKTFADAMNSSTEDIAGALNYTPVGKCRYVRLSPTILTIPTTHHLRKAKKMVDRLQLDKIRGLQWSDVRLGMDGSHHLSSWMHASPNLDVRMQIIGWLGSYR